MEDANNSREQLLPAFNLHLCITNLLSSPVESIQLLEYYDFLFEGLVEFNREALIC